MHHRQIQTTRGGKGSPAPKGSRAPIEEANYGIQTMNLEEEELPGVELENLETLSDGDHVWVFAGGNWLQGTVAGRLSRRGIKIETEKAKP